MPRRPIERVVRIAITKVRGTTVMNVNVGGGVPNMDFNQGGFLKSAKIVLFFLDLTLDLGPPVSQDDDVIDEQRQEAVE